MQCNDDNLWQSVKHQKSPQININLKRKLWGDLGELRGGFGELWGDLGRLWGDFGELWGDFGEKQASSKKKKKKKKREGAKMEPR